jgi:hypothetical protein
MGSLTMAYNSCDYISKGSLFFEGNLETDVWIIQLRQIMRMKQLSEAESIRRVVSNALKISH